MSRLWLHASTALALLPLWAAGCGSDTAARTQADAATAGSGGASAGGSGGSAGTGATAATGAGGSGGADASTDSGTPDVVDATTDPFIDAPPRPTLDGPLTIVLFGELDGVDLTGTYTQVAGADVCGNGFRVEREDGLGASAVIHWQDEMTSLVPGVGNYNAGYGFDITISRFVRIDDVPKRLTFRAGQTFPGTAFEGDVNHSDLLGAGTFEGFFTLTAAERQVDTNEGVKSGLLYLWVAGSCR